MTHENLSFFPQEILIKIFNFLPAADLISLSETCRSFYNTINSCNALMKKFKISIFDDKKNLEWNPMRKYSKIYISSYNFENFMKIFKDIGDNLEVLDIRYSHIDLKFLRQILLLCGNIKQLYIRAVSLTVYLTDPLEPLPSLKLDKFYFLNLEPATIDILKILQNSSIINLEMIGFFKQPQVLKNFLETQNELKVFELHNKLDEFLLFDDNSLSNVNFKLRSLKLNNFDLYTQLPFFSNFIRSQSDSLEIFETTQWKIFNLMGNLQKLRTVNIPSMRFTNPEPFSKVENLSITVDVSEGWAQQFPNLKSLKIQQMIDFEYSTTPEVETLNSLQELEIQYQKVVDLNLPTVKSLKLCFFSNLNDERPFNFENCKKLEELVIVRCGDAEWLAGFIEKEDTKLKKLEIQGTKLSEKCMEIIEKNIHKIENLRIEPVA